MKKRLYYYSINFTLNKYQSSLYNEQIQPALIKIREALSMMPEIKVAIFVDILMMVFLRSKYPDMYRNIYDELLRLYKNGVSMEFFLNLEWENTKDIHSLDKERILDIFAIAKYILSPFNNKNLKTKTENVNAIRIMNSKLQPFSYLREAYQFIGIKLDASTIPGLKTSPYYNYSKITPSNPHRFTIEPNNAERFGQFIALPRSIFRTRFGLHLGSKSRLKILFKHDKKLLISFLDDKKIEYSPETVYEQSNVYVLNPDMYFEKKFYELVLSTLSGTHSIVSIESRFEYVSSLSFRNIAYLSQEKDAEFVSTKDIIQTYSPTNNKLLK